MELPVGRKRPNFAIAPFQDDDSCTQLARTVADLVCLRVHFNAVEPRLPLERQTAVWCSLFLS